MSIWTQPSPSDFDRWEALLVNGAEPSTAAKSLGFTASAFRRTNPVRHAEILEVGREARADRADELMEKWAIADDAPPAIRLAYIKRLNPAYTDRGSLHVMSQSEVTHHVGNPNALDELRGRLRLVDDAAGHTDPNGTDAA